MADATVEAKTTVFAAATNLGFDLSEEALLGALSVAKASHTELFKLVNGAVALTESAQGAALKVIRDLLTRSEEFTLEALNGIEAVALSLSRTLRQVRWVSRSTTAEVVISNKTAAA